MIKTILPGQTIGIIGGGQLGRMLAMSAKEMGYKIAILDPSPDCCARIFSDKFIEANFDDYKKIEELCKISDVITFEFENIDADSLSELEKSIILFKVQKFYVQHSIGTMKKNLLESWISQQLIIFMLKIIQILT